MKNIWCLVVICSLVGYTQTYGQTDSIKEVITHKGFFFSVNTGPVIGNIVLDGNDSMNSKMEISGIGGQVDIKVGGVVSEYANLIISVDLAYRMISAPSISLNGISVKTKDGVTASDLLFGVGITKYFMPSNAFISATFGSGSFGMEYTKVNILNLSDSKNFNVNSADGFGFQLKGGIEWWYDENWGIGVTGGIAKIMVDDPEGKFSTTKYFLQLSATFN